MNPHLNSLSMVILRDKMQIVKQWKEAACKIPALQRLDEPVLTDHLPNFLEELASALEAAQSVSIIEMKAHRSAIEHGAIRFKLGFDVQHVIAEFGILRDVLQQFAETRGVDISGEVNRTVNRVVDKGIADSLQTYVTQQADEIERKRQEYLSFVIHDLKTPISAMATATNIIDQKLSSEIDRFPVTAKMLDLLRRNAVQLNERVMGILDEESRIHSLTSEGPELLLDIKYIDLWPIVERLKNDCHSIAISRRDVIRNDVPTDLQVPADPDLLLELLQNLLSNALKYTANGEIVIAGTETADSVVCSVSDTGVGIAPDRIDRIFEKRTGDPNVPQSTGLGLAIVEKIMKRHGGTISVKSRLGQGTTFEMKFFKPEHGSRSGSFVA
jgi:two-component system, OmpR family, phosphate regulon sensor histidine kinase PhoR